MLVLYLTRTALGKSAIEDERDEAHDEADSLRADEVLRVDDRRDRCADDAAEDLPDQHRSREEREQPFRLLGVVQVAGIDPEQDVDRLFDSVREHVRNGLDDVSDRSVGDRVLDPDRQQGDRRDVDEEHRAAAHAIDEEEDERGHREHRDRRDDVHPRHVLDAVALHEQRIGSELSDPVRAHHDGQQEVEEQGKAPLTAPEWQGISEEPHVSGSMEWVRRESTC
jgi:hypothetical protein